MGANDGMAELWNLGYSATDIITTLFRVVRNLDMQEYLKLEYIKVVGRGPGLHAASRVGVLLAGLCRAAHSIAWPIKPSHRGLILSSAPCFTALDVGDLCATWICSSAWMLGYSLVGWGVVASFGRHVVMQQDTL